MLLSRTVRLLSELSELLEGVKKLDLSELSELLNEVKQLDDIQEVKRLEEENKKLRAEIEYLRGENKEFYQETRNNIRQDRQEPNAIEIDPWNSWN